MSMSACLQNRFSVQFDDLFKKAWEEDIVEGATSNGELWLLRNFFQHNSSFVLGTHNSIFIWNGHIPITF